jgi:hypothetical protein
MNAKRKWQAVAAGLALVVGATATPVMAQSQSDFKVLRTDMVGYINVSDSFDGASGTISGNNCSYTLIPGTESDPSAGLGPNGGYLFNAGGSCSGIGQGELLLIPDTAVNRSNLNGPGLRDYGEVGKYDIVAPGPEGSNRMSIVDSGTYSKIYTHDGFSFIIRLNGVSANHSIN